jgi:hypothetical protein
MPIARGECVRHALCSRLTIIPSQPTAVRTVEPRFFGFERLDPETDDLARNRAG